MLYLRNRDEKNIYDFTLLGAYIEEQIQRSTYDVPSRLFDKFLLDRTRGLWIDVHTSPSFPDTGHAGQRSQVPQGVDVNIGRLGVDIVGIRHLFHSPSA